MKETRADNGRAIGYALLLHALPFALAVLELWWTGNPVAGAKTGVEAELLDSSLLAAEIQRAMRVSAQPQRTQYPQQRRTTQPMLVPVPEDAQAESPPAEHKRVPAPDTVEMEHVEQDAEDDRTHERERQESRRLERINLTERESQQEHVRPSNEAKQEHGQITDLRTKVAADSTAEGDAAALPRGNNGIGADLLTRYQAAVREAILRNWRRPGWVPLGQRCKLVINQIPGGEVIQVQVDPSCPFDELDRRSLEAAVLQAQQLPYSGFESVFQRVLVLDFEAQDQ